MQEVKTRPEYQKLLVVLEATLQEIKNISPNARAILILEDGTDIEICSPSENLSFSQIIGLLGAMVFRYQVIEAANFNMKIQAQQAMQEGTLRLYEMMPKGKAN